MKKFLHHIYLFFKHSLFILWCIIIFLVHWALPRTEKVKAYSFTGRHFLSYIKCRIDILRGNYSSLFYPFNSKYQFVIINPEILFDSGKQLHYIVHTGKRLYFPSEYDNEKIISLYRTLLIEQDAESAHKYVDSYSELDNRTVFDVGSAEGFFTLEAIDNCKNAVLIENDSMWLQPLRATFEPFKEKVIFVNKYAGEKDDETTDTITLDTLIAQLPKVEDIFIKMDIEGAELQALQGLKKTLHERKKNIKMAVCTYHTDRDAKEISEYLTQQGIQTSFTPNYMIYGTKFRKGVIRGEL